MKLRLLENARLHLRGNIAKHVANVEVLLEQPTGVAEHPNIIETIEKELAFIAEYDDKLEMLTKYF